MSAKHFVSGSSMILMAWLGATFLNEVPAQRYPKLDKNPSSASLHEETEAQKIAAGEKSPTLQASASR